MRPNRAAPAPAKQPPGKGQGGGGSQGHGRAVGRGHGQGGSSVSAAAVALISAGSARQQQGPPAVSAWTQVVNETGASFANWLSMSGTWASNGTVIQQTDGNTGLQRFARLNISLAAPLVAKFDFLIPSAGAITGQADEHLGLICGTDLSTGQGTAAICRFHTGNESSSAFIDVESNGVSGRSSTAVTATYFDTWHTIKVLYNGAKMTYWFDNVQLATAGNLAGLGSSQDNVCGLLTVNVKANFRNIKVWVLDVSALV